MLIISVDYDNLKAQMRAPYVKYLLGVFESMPASTLNQAKTDQ